MRTLFVFRYSVTASVLWANSYAHFLSSSDASLRVGDESHVSSRTLSLHSSNSGKSPAVVSLPSQRNKERAPITLFCFSFTPRRKIDEEMLEEARVQLAKCDGHMFFTDENAPGAPALDITTIKVPRQNQMRNDSHWLNHRNMAALTPVWTHLLKEEISEKYDYTINVELDHFTRPTKLKRTIMQYFDLLGQGSEWERSFATDRSKPVMLAFGNAFVFNKAMVKQMKHQWPLPGLANDAGCPIWGRHCEQDMVYPSMMSRFRPPIQMFGVAGCGKMIKNENGVLFPLACWEMYQNKYGGELDIQNQPNQLNAIGDIAAQPKDNVGTPPPTAWEHAVRHITEFQAPSEQHWQQQLTAEETVWDHYFPSKDVPLIHHIYDKTVQIDARLKLGL